MAAENIDELPRSRKAAKEAGSRHYFTGNACPAGHVAQRTTANGACVECAKASRLRWYRGNIERGQETSRRWKEENTQRVVAYRKENLARDVEKQKQRRATDPDKTRQRARDHYWRNPDLKRFYAKEYESRKRGAAGRHTLQDLIEIRAAQKDRCAYCRVGLNGKGHVDHITPVSRGGSNDRRNLQILCVSCNTSKNAKDPIAFAQSRGLLV